MVYSLSGVRGKGKLPKELPEEAQKWKGLALTKKIRISISANIPKRQFMGNSAELTAKINRIINESIERINNGISSSSPWNIA